MNQEVGAELFIDALGRYISVIHRLPNAIAFQAEIFAKYMKCLCTPRDNGKTDKTHSKYVGWLGRHLSF